MLSKRTISLGFNEALALKRIFPDKSIGKLLGGSNAGSSIDFSECLERFPKATYEDIETILKGRRFIEWYSKNGRMISLLISLTPAVAYSLVKLPIFNGFLNTNVSPVMSSAFQIVEAATEDNKVPLPKAFTAEIKPGFMSGVGYIILHVMVIGFLSLVVGTFLKFTGRGDLVPILTFISGGVILYECCTLFYAIYEAIVFLATKGFV